MDMETALHIAICDDNSLHRKEIGKCISRYSVEAKVYTQCVEFSSGEELEKANTGFDLLFLDIEMPGINGIELMQRLERRNNIWRIIFVSSHDEMVYDVFGLRTLGFVRKPAEYENIKKWLDVAVKELLNIKMVKFDTPEGMKEFVAEDILYLQADRNNVLAVTAKKLYEVKGSMKYWEKELAEYGFVRIHKSFIVNIANIDTIKTKVMIKGKQCELPVGRKHEKNIKNVYEAYVMKKVRERI